MRIREINERFEQSVWACHQLNSPHLHYQESD